MSDSLQPRGLQHAGHPIHHRLPDITQTHDSVMSSKHLILCCPILPLSSIIPSIRVFSNESALRIMWPKYWSFRICPSNEYSGLVSFRMDSFDLLDIQWALKSLLQNHSLKASILQSSAFFMVQLSHPYTTTRKKKKKNYSFDYIDLCCQSDVSAFLIHCLCLK